MNNKLNPIDVSKYIINYLNEKSYPVNHLKLQKLLYYVEAWYTVFTGSNLFEEQIEAWQHGPVIRKVWDYFKNQSILYDNLKISKGFELKASKEQIEIINDVLDEYGDKTGYYLETLTHSEEPWKIARRKNKYIDKNTMKQFYSSRLNVKKS